MSKETKTNADASAKKKADELAAKLLGEETAHEEETVPKEEPSAPSVDATDANVDYATINANNITVAPINAKLLQDFKVYDHMVKVNGVYYKAGEQVPVK